MEQERKIILLIVADIDLSLMIKTYFLRLNYEVYMAHNTYMGCTMAQMHNPGIILLYTDVCADKEEELSAIREAAPAAEIFPDRFEPGNPF